MAVSLYSTPFLLFIVISSPCLAIYTISDYRLITKDRPNAGIVEVFNQDIGWGIVCDEYWSFELASIVCSQLNFPGTSLHLTAVKFEYEEDEWPMSVTNNISTYFTQCSVNGSNMQCDTCNGECGCKHNILIGAVSCKEPGYLGCFRDEDGFLSRDRVLSNGPRYYYSTLTIGLCINACEEDGFFYAGVEYGHECFCGNYNENIVLHGNAADGECNGVCAGDNLESCGYSDLIGIYQVDLGVCEDPGSPQNGFRYNETGSLRYGSKIYFNCSDEFTLEGPEVIQCVQRYGRKEDVGIANSTHAVMWNQSIPKCTGFSSTTPSSATTKGRGQANQIPFSGTTGPKQSGLQDIRNISIAVVSGLIIIITAIIVVVVIRKRRKRKAGSLDPNAPDTEHASRNHGSGGGSPLMSRVDGEGDLFVLTDLTAHSQTAGENHYVDGNDEQPPKHPGSMDRPGITRGAVGYESVRLPSADSALNGPGGIAGEVQVDGALDLYANTEFHDVPTNLIDNELYG